MNKYKKYLVGFTTESLPFDVMVMINAGTDMVVINGSLGDSIQRGREGVGDVHGQINNS